MRQPLTLKYRPKKLTDIIGQPVVVQAFTNAFLNDNLHSTYILSGPFGSGKTSVSRILAAMLNCKTGRTLEPCGVCENCVEIFSGKSADVKEVDVGGSRSIDDIRALKAELGHSAISSRRKIVILDEAHRLTGPAADAALKMLEEPPNNTLFLLATTESHKIIDTIKSRAISWQFKKVDWRELYENLIKIAKLEKLQYEEDALKLIAKNSDGSVRNSIKNLHTVINYVTEKIDVESVSQCLGIISNVVFFNFFKAIGEQNTENCIMNVNIMFRDGQEFLHIYKTIQAYLTNMIKYRSYQATNKQKTNKDISDTEILNGEDLQEIKELSKLFSGSKLISMLGLLQKTGSGVQYNFNPQYALEAFALQAAMLEK